MPESLDLGDRQNKFDDLDLIIEKIPVIKEDFIKKIILNIRLIQSNSFEDINSIKYEELKKRKAFVFTNFILKPFSLNALDLLIDLLLKVGPISKTWREIFQKYTPDFLFLSTPGQKSFDLEPLQLANNKKIISFSAIYSLDNLTAKGLLFTNTNYLSVWSDQMKEDAVKLHGYDCKNVFVDGAAITDNFYHFQKSNTNEQRNNFLKSIGLKTHNKFITIATIPEYYWGQNHIALANDILKINPDINILIKPHPLDLTNYSSLASSRVIIDPFHGGFNATPDNKEAVVEFWKAPINHIENLSNIMMYTELVVNVASSIAIDASIFGTPGINIAFDYDDTNQILPAKDLYKYTHYKRIIETRGTYFAYDLNMLEDFIKLILTGKDLISSDRSKMSKIVYGKYDGNSINRIISNLESVYEA